MTPDDARRPTFSVGKPSLAAAARLGRPSESPNCVGNDCSGKTRIWSSGSGHPEGGLHALYTWDIGGNPWPPPSRDTACALALVVARPQSDGESGEAASLPYGLALMPSLKCPRLSRGRSANGQRSSRADTSLIADVRRQVQSVDPTQPVHDVEMMHTVVQKTMTLERTVSLMTTFFAGAALLLAMFGVYGVVSYSVRQRTVEIGMRMALGATHGNVFSMVVRSGLKLAAIGVVAGGVAALAAVSYLGSVFRLGDPDYASYVYSTAIVVVVAFAASFIPAWRATLMSPLVAIRNRL